MIAEAWTRVRALSLDVAVGGACGAALAATVTGAVLPPPVWLVLPAAIWCVYTADHLLDARRLGNAAATQRHRMHVRHARGLTVALAVVAAAGAALAVAVLPVRLLAGGCAIALAALAHLAHAQRSHAAILPKEISVAAIYTAGVWCAPVLLAREWTVWTGFAMTLFFVAAAANLLLNALVEARADAAAGFPSAALAWGEDATARAIGVAGLVTASIAVVAAVVARGRFHGAFLVLLALGVVPAVLLRFRERLEPNERYRAWGDLAFFLAALPFALR
jgi:4-hydroxybenzoate polyprenyltransferase